MILTNQSSQYLFGTKYDKKTDKMGGQKCRYEILTYPNYRYGQAINNLIATQGRLTIKTNWDLKWKVKEYFVDNYGKRYIIEEIQIMPQEVNGQILALSLTNPDTEYVLSLVEIENAWGIN